MLEYFLLKEFAKAVEIEFVKSDLIPMFNSLANDEQVTIRNCYQLEHKKLSLLFRIVNLTSYSAKEALFLFQL